MTAKKLKEKYLSFFRKKNHSIIPSSRLIPENDPTVLFTTAGMHPLVPYLLGESHPEGKRLADVQVCLRTDDIDEVGDTTHHTFFEMLGNWSLGDYWKKEAISWSFEFLTKELQLDPKRIWVTCFKGDKDAPKDSQSENIWKSLGIPKERVYFYGKKDNWWGPAGETGPCGPDTEMFFDTSGKSCGSNCKPGDNCGRFFEIWNDVFMQYNKTKAGIYEPLRQKNVDTGMGVERTTAVLQDLDDNYKVEDIWGEIMASIENETKTSYKGNEKTHRIIADHIRASVFAISEGVLPSNKQRGYVLRRLIRRVVRFGKLLGVNKPFLSRIAVSTVNVFKTEYPNIHSKKGEIQTVLKDEEEKFLSTIEKGLNITEKTPKLDGKTAFFLYETYGFPLELSEEIAEERGQEIDKKIFEKEFEKHKEKSRIASSATFKGGLADNSEESKKFHTATHLLHSSLRKILGDHVEQRGSNITAERLRFDFSHQIKLSDDELEKVENLVNRQIEKNLPVSYETKTFKEAVSESALAFFTSKYAEKVKVYTIGNAKGEYFSKEVCGGPHVESTGNIGRVKIKRQEKIGANLVRIYIVLNSG